jgi:hypothetical protein
MSDSKAPAVSMSRNGGAGGVFPAQSFIGSLGWRKLLERVLGKSGIDVSEEG